MSEANTARLKYWAEWHAGRVQYTPVTAEEYERRVQSRTMKWSPGPARAVDDGNR